MFDPKPQHDHTFSRTNSDTRLSETNKNCTSSPSDDDILQFRPNNRTTTHQESDDSGVCSPPLWKNSPSPSPSRSPSHPLLSHHCLSPNSRKNAIARGQRELMDMVRNMPESSYELSLKDIVEHRDAEIGKNQVLKKRAVFVKVKRHGSRKNGSFEDRGVFLKMGFLPFHLQSKKSKRFGDSDKDGNKTERDWWKKKFTGSSDSDKSRISSNSSGGGSSSSQSCGVGSGSSSSGRSCGRQRKKHGFVTACSCCPFFKSKITTKSIQ